MGKYAATHAYNSSTKKQGQLRADIADWLYGPWNESKLHDYEFFSHVPALGEYMSYLLDVREDEEYLKNHGMSYEDIHNPKKLHQTASGSNLFGSFLKVSENVALLYK